MLTNWWPQLEEAPSFGGPRRYLHELLGAESVSWLERTGVLRQAGISPSFPCRERGGDHCPRTVVWIDGGYHAVCGNAPACCRALILDEHDVALLTIDILGLCRIIASALAIRATPESIHELNGVHRVGTVIPEPGIRYPVYLVTRCDAQGYAEALGALVVRQAGAPFSLLIPTARFLTENVERQAAALGLSIIVLADVVAHDGDRLSCSADPVTLFSSLGQRATNAFAAGGEIVAWALVCNGKSPPLRQDLDEPAYRALLAEADSFEVFADEQTKIVHKGPSDARQTSTATASQFESIRLAVRKRGYFDPVEDDPQERASAQQIFQRARKLFDPRIGRGPWRLFKTIEGPEGSLYHFSPDSDASFAFVFLPER
jgi:hypothetical protein